MVLSFKKQFPDKIIDGSKIHTIRADKLDRWKVGNKIHFATGVRTKHYNNFKEGFCLHIQKIKFKYDGDCPVPSIAIDEVMLHCHEIEELAINDGFDDVKSFLEWFNSDFTGKIIHWTDKIY